MRRRLMLRDDRGATLVIVVLSLIAIFAMIVLTVDVGGLFLRRRAMVNGADAAALATAQSCATTSDSDVPGTIAYQYAHANVSDLTPGDGGILNTGMIGGVAPTVNCDTGIAGHVTVKYTTPQDLYFAGVLGFSGPTPVVGQATAGWGPLAGGQAVPIVLDSGQLHGQCKIPDGVSIGDTCAFWYNNGSFVLGDADWGFMNLDMWGVDAKANCSSAGSNLRGQWIQNDYTSPLTLNGDPAGSAPTYVCVDTGHATDNWQDLNDRLNSANPHVLFPVNDCTGQVDKTGTVVPCPQTPDKYDIIGFTKLKLVGLWKGNDPAAIGTSGSSGKNCNGTRTFPGASPLNLDTFGAAQGCFAGTPNNITNLVLTKDKNNDPACCTMGVDYTYDAATHAVTWIAGRTQTVKISFDWSFNGTAGACGSRPPDPNAICMKTEWEGFTLGPGPVGGKGGFGPMGIQLCDLALRTCPDQK